MKGIVFVLSFFFGAILPFRAFAAPLLYDDFPGDSVIPIDWHIPTWVSPTDGTYIGRTQFRCTQNSPLPSASNSNAMIAVDSYNPTATNSPSFYGTDLISNQTFSQAGNGILITVRAKMQTSTRGIVGGIFLYALKEGSNTLHDEIDFEFLTNLPQVVQTNIYSNEPLGEGHPQFVAYDSGSITDFHTYEIKWQPNEVSWFIDGRLVRRETDNIPAGPMNFHLNIWVPAVDWLEAFDRDLQPTPSLAANQVFTMSVDSVRIEEIPPATETNGLAPILHLLLTDKKP